MGTRLGIHEPARHVTHLRAVPAPEVYDWCDEITPEVFRWALSAVIGFAATSSDIRIRDAAHVVEARFKRAPVDECPPFGIARP